MLAARVRMDSCNQDSATIFYATATKPDQFAVWAANQMMPHSESEIPPAKAQSRQV